MKKLLVVLVVVVMVLALATPAFAARGGMPGAHGVDGRTFGGVVSGVAQADPLALAEHVRACR